MRRRRVLAGVAALAFGGGCSRLFGDGAVLVRAKRPPEGEAADATRHCVLDDDFVLDHPELERVLASAKTAPRDEWVTADTNRKQGETLAADLQVYCGVGGGVYHYDGATFVLEVTDGDKTLFPGESEGSEAIRGAPTEWRA